MTKRVLSLILAALTLLSLCAPAFASAEPAEDIPAVEAPAEDVPVAEEAAETAPEEVPEEAPVEGPEEVPVEEVPAEPAEEVPAEEPEAPAEPADQPDTVAASGTSGNITWTLTDSGTLTISGTGEMWPYYANVMPWKDYQYDITSVVIQPGVTNIGGYAFDHCSHLTSVTIPEGVTSIGLNAFRYCTKLKSVKLPSSLKSIEDAAFSSCESLTSVTMAEGLEKIGPSAFSGCQSLTSVTIPASVTDFANNLLTEKPTNPFERCFALTSVTAAAGSAILTSVNGVLFTKDMSTLVVYPAGKTNTSYSVPSGVTAIAGSAFHSADHLTSVTLPDTLQSIASMAFAYCFGLTNVTIPASVTSVDYAAFAGGTRERTITVLNPQCEIMDDSSVMDPVDKTTIVGYKGSTAEAYAKKYGYTFKVVGSTTDPTPAPAKKNGILPENGQKYYYVDGVKQKGLKTVDGKTYYFSAKDGHMLTGLVTVDNAGHKCYFSAKDGHRLTGLVTVDNAGHKCYFSAKTGYRLTGTVTVDSAGHKCYFSAKTGYRLTGLVTVDNAGHKSYFSAKTGYRLTGLVTTDSKGTQRYFSAKTSYMLKDGWYNIGGGRKALINASGVVTKIEKI